MAKGTISLGTKSNLMGQIVWEAVSNGTASNTSTMTASVQARKTSNTTVDTYGTWSGSLTIGGTAKSFSVTESVGSGAWVTLYSFSATISHSADGAGSCYLAGKVSGPYGTTLYGYSVSGSDTVELDTIPRFASITAAPNFDDEQNPTITYTNPAGNTVDLLRACISLDGTNADIAYRDISKTGTSYTFNLTEAERDVLRAATTGSNSRTVKFYVRSEIGAAYEGSNLTRTFTIKNPKPTISPTITDSNNTTFALTGSRSKLVRYYSNAQISIGAAAVKKATLTSKKVTCGNKSLTADGTINAIESGTFTFTATDNRGNTTTKDVTPAGFIDYVKLTCNMGNNTPTADGQMTVKVNGNCFNGSFGSTSNTLAVYYRFKVDGGTYGLWTAMTVTRSGNSYTATASLTGLDYQTIYAFEAYAVDKLATVYSAERKVIATPVFDWSASDFKFNVPVFDQFGALSGNGLAAYSGGGDEGIDPDTTLEGLCLTSHSNGPQGLGTFYYIHTAFYNAKSTTAARAQMAMPYKKVGSVYHRYYSGGAWSAWSRYMTADELYPVDSVVIRYDTTNPGTLYGGTWQRIEGRMLFGCATSGTVGATGTHTTGSGSSSLPYVNVAVWRRTA